MWWTEEQVDMMYEEAQYRNDLANKRKKRTLSDFKKFPNMKWSLPIHYKFDGTQSKSERHIRLNFLSLTNNSTMW